MFVYALRCSDTNNAKTGNAVAVTSSFRKYSVLFACPQILDPFYNIFCFIFESISGALFSGTGFT